MNILAFVLIVVAIVLFAIEAVRTHSLVAAGLAFFAGAFAAQLIITGGTLIHT